MREVVGKVTKLTLEVTKQSLGLVLATHLAHHGRGSGV
jgi:hypothetical protein